MTTLGDREPDAVAEETTEGAVSEIDLHIFHLKTLYDMSCELFVTRDSQEILQSFLLMSMGNFGLMRGAVLAMDLTSGKPLWFHSIGFSEEQDQQIQARATDLFGCSAPEKPGAGEVVPLSGDVLEDLEVVAVIPFRVEEKIAGILTLGEKIIGEPYTGDDKELMVTLTNNLVIALRNARSFEEITRLNKVLKQKNLELSRTLDELKAAMRKVELLEGIKANLCKFVPTTVTRLIESAPSTDSLNASERDVSVMFLDIEGYTRITERIGDAKVYDLVERYFSVFMDAIYANNGDVLMTAGDGLMVLFLSEDRQRHALDAVRAALMIKQETVRINEEACASLNPLVINIGVTSGPAVVGAVKFQTYTGGRWSYTCYGMTVNLASRICGQARGGAVLANRETVERVQDRIRYTPIGQHSLKNVSEAMELFAIHEGHFETPEGEPPA